MWGKVDQDAWQRRDPSPGEKGHPVQENGSQAVVEKAKAVVSGDLTIQEFPGIPTGGNHTFFGEHFSL